MTHTLTCMIVSVAYLAMYNYIYVDDTYITDMYDRQCRVYRIYVDDTHHIDMYDSQCFVYRKV